MTDKMKKPTKPSNVRALGRRIPGILCVVSAALFACTTVSAQDAPPGATHFRDSNTDRIPALTAFPQYPSIARRDRIEGEATVCFNIRSDGRISRAIVTNRSHRIFAKPALRAIRKSNFEPIAPGQVLATTRACRIYRFRLDPILVRTNPSPKGD